jgi:ParB-like chromosome segregation protein Spo0J
VDIGDLHDRRTRNARSVAGERLRQLRPETVDELAESITARGLVHRIIVRTDGDSRYILVGGRHRYAACQKLGETHIRAVVLDGLKADEAELLEIDENLIRADLSPAERSLHLRERKRLYEKVHPETKRGGNQGAGGKFQSSRQNGDTADRFTRDAAKKTDKSERTIQREVERGAKIADLADVVGTALDSPDELDALAKLPPDKQRHLIDRAKQGNKVSAKLGLKQLKRTTRERELGEKQLALPDKKFGVVLADDGWKDEAWSEETTNRKPDYTVLPSNDPQEIVAVTRDIFEAVCAADCVLFMWTTNQHLAIAIKVMEGRGFEYKSSAVWKKPKPGMGRWFRSRHEVLLLGTRGKVPCPAPGEQWESLIEAEPAVPGLHSSKPERFLQMIEEYFLTVPKIELNRRGPPRPGWSAWGDEVTEEAPKPRRTRVRLDDDE